MASASPAVVETDDFMILARKSFARAREAWEDNQRLAKEDLEFARLGKQWPPEIEAQRQKEGRPCLTFNKQPAFIRQVVNDARQNKPSIKVHPQDSSADPRTAEIINGLIRNIETTSDADVAYDTAIEHAVGQGFGFWRIDTAYTTDDAFEQDIVFERIANPFTVYGDPRSTAADSSDWNEAWIVTTMTRDEFEREYPNAERVDWDSDFSDCPDWLDGDQVTVAQYWRREKVRRKIVALTDGSVIDLDDLDELAQTVGEPRDVESYKVTQHVMSGAEVLKTVNWAGKYIPIVPVYGDEVIDDTGKRWFRSLIRDAKSAQQMLNFWRTTTTELIALAPKTPWVGRKGAFDGDKSWSKANSATLPYLEFEGPEAPQRQPFSGVPAGALQEALNANDDMKAIIGIYDASLGARSNETSGRAIMARQREGDVSTFHFIDNLSRAIRHCGRILLDLIPKVYSTARMARVLGEDLAPQTVPINQPFEEPGEDGNVVSRIYDLTKGKYDLTVKAGPSFTSMREEHRLTMMEAAQAGGEQIASVLVPRIAKLMDLPDADKIAAELEAKMNPPQPAIPPEMQEQIQAGMQRLQELEGENQSLKFDAAGKAEDRQLKLIELQVKERELEVKAMEARAKLIAAQQPTFVRAPAEQTM